MNIFDRITNELKKQGKTRTDLSKVTGISYNTITSLFQRKSENIKLNTLIKISEYLDVSLDWLIDGDISEKNPLNDIDAELVNISNTLTVKNRVKLLSFAYELQGSQHIGDDK
jgi:transcriptional regulator with XRE-family HTH domain